MTFEYSVPQWMLKRAAKRLSKQIDIKHIEVLDELAFELGFQNWAQLKRKGVFCTGEENPNDWVIEATNKIASEIEDELLEQEIL